MGESSVADEWHLSTLPEQRVNTLELKIDLDAVAPVEANLLTIPVELRQEIYSYLQPSFSITFEVHPKSFRVNNEYQKAPFWILLPPVYVSLCHTCRLLNLEVVPLIRGVTTWNLRGRGAINHLARYCSRSVKHRIATLTGVNTAWHQYKEVLFQFPNLLHVEVQVPPTYFHVYSSNVDRFAEADFDQILLAVTHGGFDYFGYHGIEYWLRKGLWQSFIVYVGVYFSWYESQQQDEQEDRRFAIVPCRLDLVNRTLSKDMDRWAQFNRATGQAVHPGEFPTDSISTIAKREYHEYISNVMPLQNRYARFLGYKS